MAKIKQISALEVLDSRGRPTVKAICTLADGTTGSASVPSGASTGKAEALELRDGDQVRYRGLGCRRAVANVNGEINTAIAGKEFADQGSLDRALIALDGTANKSRLGANAILGSSIAFARAVAAQKRAPLYGHFARMLETEVRTLPRLTINLFSGGKHAGGQVEIQDVLVVPLAKTIDEGLAATYAVYQSAAELCLKKYQMRALKADEGGLAPPVRSVEEMLGDAVEAIRGAALVPGKDMAIAIDVASSHFYEGGRYRIGGKALIAAEMVELVKRWVTEFPIVSVEDGLAEEDWENWPRLLEAIEGTAIVVGDDFLCTNPGRIRRAVKEKAATALLLKVNQIGTLTEAAEACALAQGAGWRVTVSARSGETEDNWLADLAVGWGGDQIKVGSIAQSERLAKYNRLLEIERDTGLPVVAWPG